MAKQWIASDHHFGHANLLTFKTYEGLPAREPWPPGEVIRMNEEIIQWHNETVAPEDTVYYAGDVAFSVPTIMATVPRMNGKKRLLLGNHDLLNIEVYRKLGFKIYPVWKRFDKEDFVLTHVPLHPSSLGKYAVNAHGHTHHGIVKLDNHHPDPRYLNICLERTDYRPIAVEKVGDYVSDCKRRGVLKSAQQI